MAIRVREVDGQLIAFCAALTPEREGDIYLHDGIDHALRNKFRLDYESEGLIPDANVYDEVRKIYEREHAQQDSAGEGT